MHLQHHTLVFASHTFSVAKHFARLQNTLQQISAEPKVMAANFHFSTRSNSIRQSEGNLYGESANRLVDVHFASCVRLKGN